MKSLTRKQKKCVAIAVNIIVQMHTQQPRRIRRWWVKPWLARRKEKGVLNLVQDELRVEDVESYKNFLRMDENSFELLLSKVINVIEKQNTNMRDSIAARDRLMLTLRFLATGESYKSLMYATGISLSAISLIIPRVCRAIFDSLKDDYLKVPTTTEEWKEIECGFRNEWNLPNVIGAVGSAGSTYYNYKGTHSIVLLALVDAYSRFTYVDVGTNGRVSDGGVFRESDLNKAFNNNSLNLPVPQPLPERNLPVPYTVVADAAFPLRPNILKPYPFRGLTKDQRIFNYRLSRGRRVVENAFGILANRFKVFLSPLSLGNSKVKDITLACCALHNFIKAEWSDWSDRGEHETDDFAYNVRQGIGNRAANTAIRIREEFKEYFMGVGSVPWQERMV